MRGVLRNWTWCGVALLGMGLCWALANPVAAPPDEPTHVIRADALAHGQLIGKPAPPGAPRAITTVTVPQVIARLQADSSCLDQGPKVPAACLQHITGSQQKVPQDILSGRYPPSYYAAIGVASYASQGPKLVYLMRAITAVIVAVLAGLALALSGRGPRWSALAVAGPFVAITPMVLNLAGSVNPSGPEIAAAVCVWVALSAIGLAAPKEVPRYLLILAAAAAGCLVLIRGLSPLWLFVAVVVIAPLIDRSKLEALADRVDARVSAIVVVAVTVAAIVWVFVVGALAQVKGIPVPTGVSSARLFRIGVDQLHLLLNEAIGDFGRLDTPVPVFCVVVVCAAVIALIGLSFWRSSGRARLALALVIAGSLVAPVAAVVLTGRRLGLVEQGRYFLPLWVGIPILAAASFRASAPAQRWPWLLRRVLIVLIAVSDVVSFYGGLRRYTVGVDGPISPFAHVAGGWNPPLPAWTLDAGFLVATAVLVVALWGRRDRPEPGIERPVTDLARAAA